ncbi:MAG: hypothetical protein KAY37_08305 [Phycisphaerae bacterium]|nr:hypothetical protein [Phycisphaerae bacterium]
MKHSGIHRLVRLTLPVLLVVLVAGCPVDPTQWPPAETYVGTYWVEYSDGELAAFELPAYRGEEGTWLTLATDLPTWYTGPALYEVSADGSWIRLTDDEDLTLDEVIQLHDPLPPVAECRENVPPAE